MSDRLDKMTAELHEAFISAIETRLHNLVDAGQAIYDLSLKHNHADGKTTICVRGIPDSEFWIEHGENSVTVRGEAAK